MYKGNLVFATNNANKIKEINYILPGDVRILSLGDIGCQEDLPETHFTLEENALEKASFVHEKYEVNCFAEDTGLEVKALNGEPGVFSARYAGEGKDHQKNIKLLLEKMKGIEERAARFRTIIALIVGEEQFQFEGIVEGKILEKAVGEGGFGYDPVFQPSGYDVSFAEMELEEKSKISHRKRAVQKLVEFLDLF